MRSRLHLAPFFKNLGLSEITAGKIQEYRIHRQESAKCAKPPAHNTMHQEMVTLGQTLKTAIRHRWLDRLNSHALLSERLRALGYLRYVGAGAAQTSSAQGADRKDAQ